MNLTKMLAVAVFVAGCLLTAGMQAQEQHIKRSELPSAVQKILDQQSKAATIRGYSKEMEGGKLEYQVEMTVNGHSKDVSMDEDGNIIEVEEQVAWTSCRLPSAPEKKELSRYPAEPFGRLRDLKGSTVHADSFQFFPYVSTLK